MERASASLVPSGGSRHRLAGTYKTANASRSHSHLACRGPAGYNPHVRPTHPARGPAVPVQMELKRIIISEVHEQQIIVLREVDGERSFPIVIGIFEATSIDRRVKNVVLSRPLTHDLIVATIDQLGGDLPDIVISELHEHTYF